MTLAFFGASLLDTGNLTFLLAPFGIEPFPAGPVYGAGGKASNKQVGSETLAEVLGIDGDSLIPRYTLSTTPDVLVENVNYAIAGARTRIFDENDVINRTATDLQSQARLFVSDFVSAGGDVDRNPTQNFVHHDVDGIFSIGSNNVLSILDNPNLGNIIFSPDKGDDRALIRNVVTDIVRDIDKALDILDGKIDDVVIVGLTSLGDTPLGILADAAIDYALPDDYSNETRDLLTGIAQKVNKRLINKYDGNNDVEDVLVIDGLKFLRSDDPINNPSGLDLWKNEVELMGLKPYTETSYLDYITENSASLPPGLIIDQFAFVDAVHPNYSFSDILAKNIIAPAILKEFPDFGLA